MNVGDATTVLPSFSSLSLCVFQQRQLWPSRTQDGTMLLAAIVSLPPAIQYQAPPLQRRSASPHDI